MRYQSQRSQAYQETLDRLKQSGHAFPCGCSRKQLAGQLHKGVCRVPDQLRQSGDYAWRFCIGMGNGHFMDGLQGEYHESLEQDIGDFVIKRRDGPWSYQLAVVVDDADQNITHVVRGIDLIDSTIRQQCIQQALDFPIPQYSHIPVAVENNGQKLSKQNLATALQTDGTGNTLWHALLWLRQSPPADLRNCGNEAVLKWAITHWQPQALAGIKENPAPLEFLRHN